MLAFRFVLWSARLRRSVLSLFCSFSSFALVLGLVLWLCLWPLFLASRVVFRCSLVSLPCPSRRPSGAPSLSWLSPARRSVYGWRFVSSAGLGALFRRGAWVWAVRPACVFRGAGVVLSWWVWVGPCAWRPSRCFASEL